jgi:hypothetical protein
MTLYGDSMETVWRQDGKSRGNGYAGKRKGTREGKREGEREGKRGGN